MTADSFLQDSVVLWCIFWGWISWRNLQSRNQQFNLSWVREQLLLFFVFVGVLAWQQKAEFTFFWFQCNFWDREWCSPELPASFAGVRNTFCCCKWCCLNVTKHLISLAKRTREQNKSNVEFQSRQFKKSPGCSAPTSELFQEKI